MSQLILLYGEGKFKTDYQYSHNVRGRIATLFSGSEGREAGFRIDQREVVGGNRSSTDGARALKTDCKFVSSNE